MTTDLARFPVTIEIPVQWGDMDAFQHVNNAVYFRWFESARIAYFERTGLSQRAKAEGIGPILGRAVVDYKIPLTYPDTVRISATVASFGTTSFVMRYRCTSAARDGALAAEGEGVVVLVDYKKGGKVALDEQIKGAILRLEGSGGGG
jgi:acyl-CoA thioester hydrolase